MTDTHHHKVLIGGVASSMERKSSVDTKADFYAVESLLNEEEKAVRDEVRNFVDRKAMPIIADHFDRGVFPMELIPPMAAMGLFGLQVDGYGCRERNHITYGLICQELGKCDSGLRAMFSVQNSLAMYPIYAFGTEEQREKWLPPMARGEAIGCFGLSEPGFGSNPSGMLTRAERGGNGYLINGTKMWITNGSIAKVAIVGPKPSRN
jgi:glutaryl-CoA dehydrogenase